jgi:hypothetical protein
LGVIGIVPNGGFAKVAMKANFLHSFISKETKTKRVQPWLHEMEVDLKIQHLKSDKERIQFAQTFFREHAWDY